MREIRDNGNRLTRKNSATAGGHGRRKHQELFHEIKSAHRVGQRLAASLGLGTLDDNSSCNEIIVALALEACPEGRRSTIFRVR
jgi:hypothetical protein